jgi:hypothetical protein
MQEFDKVKYGCRGDISSSDISRYMRTSVTRPHEPAKLPISEAGGGVLPGVDLNDSSALLDRMELDMPEAGVDSAECEPG